MIDNKKLKEAEARAKQDGREYFRKFTVFDLTQIFAVLSLFGS